MEAPGGPREEFKRGILRHPELINAEGEGGGGGRGGRPGSRVANGQERIQERNSARPAAYKRRGGGRGRVEGREAGEQGCQERIQERNSARPGAYKP